MKTKFQSTIILIFALAFAGWVGTAHALEVKSPDGKLKLTFEVKNFGSALACPVYRVDYQGTPIITDSRLGLNIKDAPLLDNLSILGSTTNSSVNTTWKPIYGERSVIPERYNQVIVPLKETKSPNRMIQITFRAYNEGVAFCYTIPAQSGMDSVTINSENSEFRFLADYQAWAVSSAQGIYKKVPLSGVMSGCERPLPIQLADSLYAALGEARLVDFARMKFAPLAGAAHSLVSKLDGPVTAALPLTSPWRFVMVAGSPGQLLENNFLVLNLNDPCALADTSWIKPGKAIREVTLTTTGGKACVDLAVKRNLQYVEFDAGWYGYEYSAESDATAVHVDPSRSKGPLDLQAVIDYGKEHGIGIILYVNHLALEKQLDVILPLYKQWGVKGIKYGFVNVGSQQWTAWLHEAIRKAANYQMMIDIHDEYRVTGYTRTYPNLMTVEGIHGDEGTPSNALTTTILFSRMLAGSADNTVCYYDARVDANWTHAYQLAKPICIYSPWTFLYWYDRPPDAPQKMGGAGKGAGKVGNEPELEFYDAMPTVWDETKVLAGQIGEYAAIARRSGANWFIGCMNANQARTLDLPLNFLDPDRKYIANIYSDDPAVATLTHVKIERIPVDSRTVLHPAMSDKGGVAVRIVATNGVGTSASYH